MSESERCRFLNGVDRSQEINLESLYALLRWEHELREDWFDLDDVSILIYAVGTQNESAVCELLSRLDKIQCHKTRQEYLSSKIRNEGFLSVGIPGGTTSLMIAATFTNSKMCELLLRAGADPYERCAIGNDALQLLSGMKNLETLEFWLDRFPDWDFERANYPVGGKALLTASFMGSGCIVNRLIIAGANPFTTQDSGGTCNVICMCSCSFSSNSPPPPKKKIIIIKQVRFLPV